MKYENKKKINNNDVFTFTVGVQELILLKDMLNHYKKAIPRNVETESVYQRIRNMVQTINKIDKNLLCPKFQYKNKITTHTLLQGGN